MKHLRPVDIAEGWVSKLYQEEVFADSLTKVHVAFSLPAEGLRRYTETLGYCLTIRSQLSGDE